MHSLRTLDVNGKRENTAGVIKGVSVFKRMREIGTCLFLRRKEQKVRS